ncbi:hypothetical protein V8E53_005884 [Lactarius tabidus]
MTADGVMTCTAVIAALSATEAHSRHLLGNAVATWGKDVLSTNAPETSVDAFESIISQGVCATITIAAQRCKYTVWVGRCVLYRRAMLVVVDYLQVLQNSRCTKHRKDIRSFTSLLRRPHRTCYLYLCPCSQTYQSARQCKKYACCRIWVTYLSA